MESFTIERTFNAPVEKVWEAITDRDQMKKWYFDIDKFKPEVGFEFSFRGESDCKVYIHLCKILELIPQEKLSYSWKYEGYSGSSVVTFELFSMGNKIRLKLTHAGLETFPSDMPDFRRESFASGWTHIIGTSLPNFVEVAVDAEGR